MMPVRPAPPTVVDHDVKLDQFESVCAWRTHVLLDAGYPVELAWRLAILPWHEVDLHVAAELVTVSHCSPELAAEILL